MTRTDSDRRERTSESAPSTLRDALERLWQETALSATLQLQVEEYRCAVAARIRDEERYKQIIDTAMDAVITIDETGIITGWNAQAVSMFGLSRKEAIGTHVSRIIPDEMRELHEEGNEATA